MHGHQPVFDSVALEGVVRSKGATELVAVDRSLQGSAYEKEKGIGEHHNNLGEVRDCGKILLDQIEAAMESGHVEDEHGGC